MGLMFSVLQPASQHLSQTSSLPVWVCAARCSSAAGPWCCTITQPPCSCLSFRKYFKLACLESGRWEEAQCEPVSCAAPPDVFQGMYTCTNSLRYDTRCTLRCQDPAENVSVSFWSLRWSFAVSNVDKPSQMFRNVHAGPVQPVWTVCSCTGAFILLLQPLLFSLVLKLLIPFLLKCLSSCLISARDQLTVLSDLTLPPGTRPRDLQESGAAQLELQAELRPGNILLQDGDLSSSSCISLRHGCTCTSWITEKLESWSGPVTAHTAGEDVPGPRPGRGGHHSGGQSGRPPGQQTELQVQQPGSSTQARPTR